MDVKTIFTLASVGLFVICITIGAMWGFKRGLAKSGLRIGYFVAGVIIVGLFTGLITDALLGINIAGMVGEPEPVSIKQYIIQSIASDASVKEILDACPNLLTIIEGLPVMLIGSVVFIVCMYLVKFLTWIIFAITARFIIQDKIAVEVVPDAPNLQQAEALATHDKTKFVKKKRHPWWGALVGGFFGFMLLVLTFFPINAIARTYVQLTAVPVSEVSAEEEIGGGEGEDQSSLMTNADGTYKKSYQIVNDAIPAEVKEYIDMYCHSFFAKTTGVFGFDTFMLDQISKIKVDGETIKIRGELVNAVAVYDDCVVYLNTDFSEVDFKTFDFEHLEDLVDRVFDSGFLRSIANDVIPYVMDSIKESEEMRESDPETYAMVVKVIDAFGFTTTDSEEEVAVKVMDVLKNDIKALIKVVKVAAESGLIDEMTKEEADMDAITAIIEKDEYKLIDDIFTALYSSTTVKNLTAVAYDIALTMVAGELGVEDLPAIDVKTVDFDLVKNQMTGLIKSVLGLADEVDVLDTDTLTAEMFKKNSTINISNIFGIVGDLLDFVKSNGFYGNATTTQFDIIMDALNENEEYSEYFDFAALKDHELSIKTEILKISESITILRESGLLELMTKEPEEGQEPEEVELEDMVDMLIATRQNGKTYIREALTPLIDNVLLKKVLLYGFDYISDEVHTMLEISDSEEITYSEDLTAQKETILNAIEEIFKNYSVIMEIAEMEEFDINDLTDAQIGAIEKVLTALQANAYFDKTADEPKGGVFKPLYLGMKDYILQDKEVDINFETITWDGFVKSLIEVAKKMETAFEGEVTTGSMVDFITENKDDMKTVIGSMGYNEELVDNIVDVATNMEAVKEEGATNETVSEALSSIGLSLKNIDQETLDNVSNLVTEFTGQDFSEYISTEIVEKEAGVATSLADALTNGVTTENVEDVLTAVNGGSGYVLDAVAGTGLTVDAGEMTEDDFNTALENAGITDESSIETLKTLFGFGA